MNCCGIKDAKRSLDEAWGIGQGKLLSLAEDGLRWADNKIESGVASVISSFSSMSKEQAIQYAPRIFTDLWKTQFFLLEDSTML